MPIRRLFRRLHYLLYRDRYDAELREEMNYHRDLAGSRTFGNDALAMNHSRDVWVAPWLQDVTQDVRFALRMLAKDRRFTLGAVTALALGMGVNLSVFAAVYVPVMRNVPFDEPERLVRLRTIDARGNEGGASWPDLQDWRAHARSFAALAADTGGSFNLSEPDRLAERLRGAYVSANTFRMLRVTPVAGRDFVDADDRPGAPSVAIISDEVWRLRYGRDPGVIGRSVKINGLSTTIVGVMPPDFRYPFITQVWAPLTHSPAFAGGAPRRDARTLNVVARLADHVSVDSATAELQTVASQLATQYPETNAKTRIVASSMKAAITQNTAPMLFTIMGAVAVVLLIACTNLAALLLARSTQRAREIAVRAALGASRWRIVRQLLTECALLATGAGLIGAALAQYGAREIAVAFSPIEAGTNPRDLRPYWLDLSPDIWTAVFLAALCIVVTFACGLVPALQVSRTRVYEALKDGGRTSGGRRARRWTAGLMVAQIAMTLVLLTAAGLLWRRFVTAYLADPGVPTTGLVAAQLTLPSQKYRTPEMRQQFFDALQVKIAAGGDIAGATVSSHTPLVGFAGTPRVVSREDTATPVESSGVTTIAVGQRYFETLGILMVLGRSLELADTRVGQEGVVVDQRFATMYFPEGTPLGRRIQLTTTAVPPASTPWLTVVGVAQTLPAFGAASVGGVRPLVYVPLAIEDGPRAATIVVRSGGSIEHAVTTLREGVRSIDPDLPLYAVQTLDATLASTRYPVRLLGTWASTLAVIALVVAAVGFFALTAHAVAERRQEIGIRLALGAPPPAMVWNVMRRTVLHLALGLSTGIMLAIVVGPQLQLFTGPMSPRDPITITLVSVLLVVIALIATLVPARRAARIDPALTLRSE